MIEYDNKRWHISVFFSCRSMKRLEGYGESDLDASIWLGGTAIPSLFLSIGAKFLFCCLLLILVTVECVL